MKKLIEIVKWLMEVESLLLTTYTGKFLAACAATTGVLLLIAGFFTLLFKVLS